MHKIAAWNNSRISFTLVYILHPSAYQKKKKEKKKKKKKNPQNWACFVCYLKIINTFWKMI